LIAGPTASGKSSLALEIAQRHGGVIVNADALQVFDCWQLLSARPSSDDLARAAHALYEQQYGDLDPKTRAAIDTNNPARVQRAWEVARATGRSILDWQAETPPPILPLKQCHAVVLMAEKDWLTPRISQRFEAMIDHGALEEVDAMRSDWDPSRPSSKAIGAPELMAYLDGQITLEAAVEKAVIASRQYAKRQRTWFRARMRDWHHISADAL